VYPFFNLFLISSKFPKCLFFLKKKKKKKKEKRKGKKEKENCKNLGVGQDLIEFTKILKLEALKNIYI
jgi:hypothetical protein